MRRASSSDVDWATLGRGVANMRSAVDSARESDDRDFCMMGPPMQERAFGGRLSLDILANRCWTAWSVSQTCCHPPHASGVDYYPVRRQLKSSWTEGQLYDAHEKLCQQSWLNALRVPCMSALGQKRTCAVQTSMSALHPIATA